MKYTTIFLMMCFGSLLGQNIVQLSIQPQWQGRSLVLDTTYLLSTDHSVTVEVCKFYISAIAFLHDNQVVFEEKNSFHLLDTEHPASLDFNFDIGANTVITSMRFKLGIDSITHASGALGGDLDPTKGMYWTWQTGYINAKIEGISSVSTDRNKRYGFHLGGYKKPFDALQTIELPVNMKGNKIVMSLNLSTIIESIDIRKQNSIMSPSTEAVKIAGIMAENFKIISQ
jgi:hypothetical protein